jgi:hypothetical protein
MEYEWPFTNLIKGMEALDISTAKETELIQSKYHDA